jgi:AcrR family transcriptional regulator
MPKKNNRNTRGRIISAAWKLFYENGYEETTIEEIVYESHTSRGSFYHYFEGKDALLGTLAYVFDEKYEQLESSIDPSLNAKEALIYLNHELFAMIEDSISIDLLSRLLSTQLLAQGEKALLDRNRIYFRLLRKIIGAGRRSGLFREDLTENEITRAYALWERALMYDWCLAGGEYSLLAYTDKVTPPFIESLCR